MRKHLTYEWMGDSNCIEHIFHNVKKRIKMKCDIGKLWRRPGPRKECTRARSLPEQGDIF